MLKNLNDNLYTGAGSFGNAIPVNSHSGRNNDKYNYNAKFAGNISLPIP